VRRSPGSLLGTPGGRLVAFATGLLLVAGAFLAVRWLAPSGPLATEVVQDGLEHPWDIAFTADGRMLVTERAGRVLVFRDGSGAAPLLGTATIPDVRAELESGLMGIAVHGNDVFVCATRGDAGSDPTDWRVELLHATLAEDGRMTAFEPMPFGRAQGAPRHQGCAVEIGPDEHLWLTIGDANLPAGENRAQDPASLNGKVIRLELDGSIPSDAPFPSGAVSLGHRNPQGIAFGGGRVVSVEHGTDVNDEINVVVPGANFGYPCVTGASDVGPIPDACDPDAVLSPPAWASGDPTLATSGAVFLSGEAWADWRGHLVVTTLKEEDVRRFVLRDDGAAEEQEVLLDGRYGRLRAAVIGPDGALYLSTANGQDDRIVRAMYSP
jgi:glucose/arabinose dehydrogenase